MKMVFKRILVVLIICSFPLFSSTQLKAAEECCCWSNLMILYEEYGQYCEVGGVPFHECGMCFIVHLWGAGKFNCKADDECGGGVGCGESVVTEFEAWYYEDCSPCLCDPPTLPSDWDLRVICDEYSCGGQEVECDCD